MEGKKEEKKGQDLNNTIGHAEGEDLALDGKTLHDLYRHTAKLIK